MNLRGIWYAAVLGSIAWLAVAAPGQIDGKAIIQRSVEANRADWEAAPNYDNYETDKEDGGPASVLHWFSRKRSGETVLKLKCPLKVKWTLSCYRRCSRAAAPQCG